MRRLAEPRQYLPALALVFLLVLPLLLPPFLTHILIMMGLFAVLGMAWNLLGGYGGQLSLGNAAFFGMGAYASTLLVARYGISPWFTLWIGGLAAFLLSIPVGAICFRLRGPYFAIATIGLAEVLRLLVLHFRDVTNGAQGMTIPFKGSAPWHLQFRSKVPYYYLSLAMVLTVIWITARVERSRLGNYLVAIGQEQDAAEAVGVHSARAKQQANALMAFLTGVAGVFYAQYVYFIEPDSVFGLNLSVQVALVAIVGGVGTVRGPVVGAVIMETLIQVTQMAFAGAAYGLEQIVYGSFLILVILLKPRGVIGWVEGLYAWVVERLPGPGQGPAPVPGGGG